MKESKPSFVLWAFSPIRRYTLFNICKKLHQDVPNGTSFFVLKFKNLVLPMGENLYKTNESLLHNILLQYIYSQKQGLFSTIVLTK